MKYSLLLALLFSACDGGSVDVSQNQDNQQRPEVTPGEPATCVDERRLETIDGILVCTESLICNGTTVRGPEIISVPLRQCNNIAAEPNFVPTPFHVEQSGGIQGNFTNQ